MKNQKTSYILGLLRICMGFIFLWAFLDKVFGLGFSTTPEKTWLAGNSPTLGFLKSAQGLFAPLYQNMAGNPVVDWLFMLGLLLLGLALILGIGMKVAGYAGALLMLMMWSSHLPPAQNPILDDHIIYLLVLLALPELKAGQFLGLGKWWANTSIVKKCSCLE